MESPVAQAFQGPGMGCTLLGELVGLLVSLFKGACGGGVWASMDVGLFLSVIQ